MGEHSSAKSISKSVRTTRETNGTLIVTGTLSGATSGSGPNGASYTVSEGADSDAVLVTIPKGNANRKFVRIQATVPQN